MTIEQNYSYVGDSSQHYPRLEYRLSYGEEYTHKYELWLECVCTISQIISILDGLQTKYGSYTSVTTDYVKMRNDAVDDESDEKNYNILFGDHLLITSKRTIIKFIDVNFVIQVSQSTSGSCFWSILTSDSEASKNLLHDFVNIVHATQTDNMAKMPLSEKNAKFYMVIKTSDGYRTSPFKYDYVKFNNLQIDEHYNSDFVPIDEKIVKHINEKKSSGVVILHGVPGTGKTTYLRHLISKCKKQIIYLPPDMTNYMSDPGFIGFMKTQSNSVFIVEDAEEILRKRGETGNSGAVSNILNVSDGILADVLHFNFIFTINCEIDEVDPALRRPGRLVAEYKFKELESDKTCDLIYKLYPDTADKLIETVPHKGLTLAQIYNLKEQVFLHTPKKNGIGFTANISNI